MFGGSLYVAVALFVFQLTYLSVGKYLISVVKPLNGEALNEYKVFNLYLYSLKWNYILFIFSCEGYIANSTTDYLINWTMPHCVLCLRLIAVTIDVYDGTLPEVSPEKY